ISCGTPYWKSFGVTSRIDRMCGIAGFVGKRRLADVERAVSAMMEAMHSRGPDDHGLQSWQFGSLAVCCGHRRLSIIDLSAAGHQPFSDSSRRYWVTFNGEIYNFRELRRLTETHEGAYLSQTDTEVIVNGFARWSTDLFTRLRGMFAFGLLDVERRRLHLV